MDNFIVHPALNRIKYAPLGDDISGYQMAAGDAMCSDELLGPILAHDAASTGCALHTPFSFV